MSARRHPGSLLSGRNTAAPQHRDQGLRFPRPRAAAMRRDEVLALYDRDYAGTYDQRFIFAEHTAPNARRELELIGELLAADGASWLDIGCGTGWFLAQFPGVKRAGLDLSAAMLELARERSPDADFRQGDFREPVPEWQGAWSLVSCMWAAY